MLHYKIIVVKNRPFFSKSLHFFDRVPGVDFYYYQPKHGTKGQQNVIVHYLTLLVHFFGSGYESMLRRLLSLKSPRFSDLFSYLCEKVDV